MPFQFLGRSDMVSSAALRRLADDIDRVSRDGGPTLADLAAAPILNHWKMASSAHVVLVGLVDGHPILGSGRIISTSAVALIDTAGGWARSRSRFYRLGEPFPDLDEGADRRSH